MTTEFSFVLKPSEHGVGVFAVHDITKGDPLRLFTERAILRKKTSIPESFRGHCIDRGYLMGTPKDFGQMEIGWYVNHLGTPNAHHVKYNYFALRDIKAGEEITIDYGTLEEPEDGKEDFYK